MRKAVAFAVSVVAVSLLGSCDSARELPLAPRLQSFSSSEWSEPVMLPAPVNLSTANDQGPALSPDGLALYFCSNRSGVGGNDLFVSRRTSEEDLWGEPVNLGAIVNSTGGDCGPSFSEDGLLLFFTSNRAGGAGNNDIYMSSRSDVADDASWAAPVRLGPEVNTDQFEFSPFVTRVRGDDCGDGAAGCEEPWMDLYFERGAGSAGANEIMVIRADAAGNALGPASPVAEVNSEFADGRPTVRHDGREMLLQSNRGVGFDLYVSTRQSVNHRWSTPERVAELSVAGRHEIQPYLSRDGRTIFFNRGLGQAGDIWIATRTPSGH